MNEIGIRHVRDYLNKLPKQKGTKLGFNMMAWRGRALPQHDMIDRSGHACGSVACIAGWSEVLLKEDGSPRARPAFKADTVDSGEIAQRLGMDEIAADDLFYARGREKLSDITIPMAVKVLDHLLKTGKVDWRIV